MLHFSDVDQFKLPEDTTALPFVSKPLYVAFSDLDETYMAHVQTPERLQEIRKTEAFLEEAAHKHKLVLCWVTGSVLEMVLRKIAHYHLKRLPQLLATSLGTELYCYDPHTDSYQQVHAWRSRSGYARFCKQKIESIIKTIYDEFGYDLTRDFKEQQSEWKISFFFPENVPQKEQIIERIQHLAVHLGIAVFITPCNPMAGDPDNHLDIDFVPKGCGKEAVVDFVRTQFDIPVGRTFAFGDSGNDLAMLKSVGHGFVVNNAMPVLDGHGIARSEHAYAGALSAEIKAVLGF